MADTERLINKAQGDSIISAIQGITARLQEMYTVDDALSSTSEKPVQNKVIKGALDDKADESELADKADKSDIASTQTATGNPITLTDCAPINAQSLVVELEPKQDLHGQSAPYVGGAGKNKLPMTVESIKSKNTAGTWNNNVYTKNNMSFEILTDGANNVTGIKVNGTKNISSPVYFTIGTFDFTANESYKVNGGVDLPSPIPVYFAVNDGVTVVSSADYTQTFTSDTTKDVIIVVERTQQISNVIFHPMIRLSTEQDATFAPYSNVCPITGYTECEVDTADSATDPTITNSATIQFGQTVYGGSVNFKTGVVTVTDANIASYAGETLPSTWISDRDAYSSGGTPTTGAQVVYKLSTPTALQLTPQELKLLKGTNNITTNGTTITLGYQPDNVIGEVKGEIEKCSPNPEFMHFEVNENVVDAIPIIFDEAIHSYTVSGDNWKDKTFLCVECCDMRYGILQLVLSSDMAFVDSCGKALMLYPYMRSIEQYIKITISLGQSYGYEISYQTTNTSSPLDYLKIRVRLFN